MLWELLVRNISGKQEEQLPSKSSCSLTATHDFFVMENSYFRLHRKVFLNVVIDSIFLFNG